MPDENPETAVQATNVNDVWNLRLYVVGTSPKSQRAIDNLKHACDHYLAGRYTIEVVDLLERPQLAADDQILAVPTLVRRLPPPIRKLVGDLSDTEKLLVGLQIRPGGVIVTDASESQRYSLTLYVNGASPRSMAAVETLRQFIDDELPGQVDLEVIDVHEQPALLLRDEVFTAPTLVKRMPEPLRRLVGNLSDSTRVRLGLGIDIEPVARLDVFDDNDESSGRGEEDST